MKQEIKERVEKIRRGEVPDGYRKTNVGIIPDDWNVKELSKIADVRDGTHESPKYVNEGIPFITSKNLLGTEIDWQTINYITKKDHLNFSKRSKVDDGDILFGMIGTIGNPTLVKMDFEFSIKNMALIKFRDSEINNKYLLNILKSFIINKQFHQQSNSAVQQFIALGTIRNLKIPLCDNKEQQKIAEILSTWDKAIELKEKLIEEEKEFKRGLMQKLLTGEIRFPEFTGEWKKVTIGNIFEEVKTINGDISKDIEILTISAKHGFLSQKDKFSKVIAGSSLKKYTHLLQNDFAYNKGNSKTAPFGCIFKLDIKEGLVPFVYICFHPTQMIDVDFFDFYFKHGLLDRQLKRIITSGARSDGLLNVSKDNFFNIKIFLPSIEEQKKIGIVLKLIQNEIDYSIAELNHLKEQKRGLMQLLLTGIVRVEVD